jgi:hypothetical protein
MEEATKTAYVSPPDGVLDITIIRDQNPRVNISLDLGIPNFTVFSMTMPLAEGEPRAMSGLIAEAVNVLLDEVASFMLAQEYEEPVIVKMYQTVLNAFKSMSTEANTSKEQDATGQDPTVSTFEGTFDIPMDFINATQQHVVTGAIKGKIKREPKVRHIELTYSPKQKTKPSDTQRVIRQYRNRSLKQQPKPMFVIVYDQLGRPTGTIPIGTGKQFKNQLLKMLKKGSVDFTAPVSFANENEMKAQPLNGIPRAISLGGMTYQPEGVAGTDMALYAGPQDYIVKFPDGRSQVFPGRPTFRKMRLLNFPVPKSRVNWTLIPQDSLEQPGKYVPEEAPQEEIKEAAEPETSKALQPGEPKREDFADDRSFSVAWDDWKYDQDNNQDTVKPEQVMQQRGNDVVLKPMKTYDDLVPLPTLQKRLVRDKLQGRQIYVGLMLIERMGYLGRYQGKNVDVSPTYYIRRYGVKRDDGAWQVYHLRGDGKAQKVGFRPLTDEDFQQAKPVDSGITTREGV